MKAWIKFFKISIIGMLIIYVYLASCIIIQMVCSAPHSCRHFRGIEILHENRGGEKKY